MVNILKKKDNIYGVNFDSSICTFIEYIHVKEYMTFQPSFLRQMSIFCVKTGINGYLCREICTLKFESLTHYLVHAYATLNDIRNDEGDGKYMINVNQPMNWLDRIFTIRCTFS